MTSHRYEPVSPQGNKHYVNTRSEDDAVSSQAIQQQPIPSSPPPSFYSRTPSPSSRRLLSQDPLHSDADRTLADAFGDDDGHSDDEEGADDRQRLMRGSPANTTPDFDPSEAPAGSNSNNSAQPAGRANASASRVIRGANDGVFANLSAKPERGGEKLDDLPPEEAMDTYEQAAADAAPPYWETTIVAPGMSSDEVYVEGLPVGSVFSFAWNGMISPPKNGSRAGLGLTMVQYGFYMRNSDGYGSPDSDSGDDGYVNPPDPNSHNFNPGTVDGSAGTGGSSFHGLTTSDWLSYVLMVVGWFILIRAISDYLRARRHEQLILQSPNRGLPVPIISENERSETAV
ncbi:hypothetical protein MGYG_00484 [Nannizzia gypsea CBS 118893]|uniref:Metal homeostatis protein BSD2 n=1 Tax=Arthroderma gypseum (strain ATCC MYA-4604 / CBS 118893) TaxID=535722 RepID=E5QZY0_ARTGP|nr:hypothetical protein MGYG_00484 [Nannizzia gypsea CBS 118893]EFQ97443.1 hypothetical protein MGYG_00484 [Nannizzia gypsea CBS 118893]